MTHPSYFKVWLVILAMMYLGASSRVYHRRYIFIFPLITPANVLMFYFVMNFINPTE